MSWKVDARAIGLISLIILAYFAIDIILRMYAYSWDFFKRIDVRKSSDTDDNGSLTILTGLRQVLDAVVVIIAIVLEGVSISDSAYTLSKLIRLGLLLR
jgi:hypothetical protein